MYPLSASLQRRNFLRVRRAQEKSVRLAVDFIFFKLFDFEKIEDFDESKTNFVGLEKEKPYVEKFL